MAQINKKVTDFFASKKRNPDAHPLKRQKLHDFDDSFGKSIRPSVLTDEGAPALDKTAAVVKQTKKTVKSSRKPPTKDNTQSTRTKRNRGKQLTLTDSLKQSSSTRKTIPTETFDFNLSAALPSDCDSVVKEYDTNPSPRSTPSKRSSRNQSTSAKRKRAAEPSDNVTPKTDKDNTVVEKTPPVRKKLDMLTSAPSDASTITASAENQEVSSQSGVEELKAKLKNCGKLSDLKACLENVRNLTSTIKDKKAASSSSSVVAAKSKPVSSSSGPPAYERYKDLAVKIPPTLTLPYKYKLLEDMFKGTDTVLSIMYNRIERCTFDKLKRAVQEMIRRNFEPKHLGQIKSVYPESYELRQEAGIVHGGVKSNKYQMTIEPVLEVSSKDVQVTKRKDGRPAFSGGEVVRRKGNFRRRLFDIVRSHHQKFLESLKPAVKVDPQKVTKWHPKFLLDEVPDVEAAELPEPPEAEKELVTARDVLAKARGKVPSKVEQALKKVAEASEKVENIKNLNKTAAENRKNVAKAATDTKAAISNSTSGISSSLLERIRAKESLKAQAAMLRDESTELEMEILGRLPEMIKILRSYFITEKKAALPEDSIVIKLCDSYRSSISQSSVEKHIDYMVKSLPDWISRVTISTGKYIRINRQTEVSTLNSQLKELLKQKQYYIPDV